MTVRQLFERLQQLMEHHADLPVYIWEEYGQDTEVASLVIVPSNKVLGIEAPDRVQISGIPDDER